jgi:DNA polymerase-3 subunit alpha
MGRQSDASFHLLLLAADLAGWRNLMKLSTLAYLEGFYYRPRIDRELLARHHEGLIATTACIGGEVPAALLRGDADRARRIAGEYLDLFGPDRFFIEVQNQGEADQNRANPMLAALAREIGVGLVGTNDVHFLRREDKAAHEVLTCILTGKKPGAEDGLAYSQELYLKSPEEMALALAEWPEAVRNTQVIAERCNVELDFTAKHLPVFRAPDGSPPGAYLERLAWDGLRRRFEGREPPKEYVERLRWELQVIEDKGYSSYFLIVHDFVDFARRNSIPAAPRGSGVATLLGYALGVADVDPLRYGLLFERFTDPQRQEDPDLDIDFCQDGRDKVIQYVRGKYGHVAQIITYGTLKARAVIRDVGRVLDVPIPDVDRIAKLIPDSPKATIAKALGEDVKDDERDLVSPDFRRLYESDETCRRIVDHGRRIEGLARHSGVHAAGVVIADQPLDGFIPLCRQADSEDPITQWDGPTCGKAGMMKMDFLGLRTLTILQRTREMVRAATGTDIDPEALPLDDPKVFDLFRNGETDGLFQFESEGMKGVLRQMQPNRIEDLIAANAMYRPGPMKLIPLYCERKKGLRPIESVHELVDDVLAETYGIMVYQEQVMMVLNRLGKLPLNRALTLIKAISKKKQSAIEAERPAFLQGARENGIAEGDARSLFDLILEFAGYGFNKAHSTRYAIVAYQTAWFKTYHPRPFLAATLTYESADRDKVVQYMAEARRVGIAVAPPDINTCESHFTVDGEAVRFGLMAVKGIGAAAIDAIVRARAEGGPFESLFDFCRRVDLRAVNKAAIEALIRCGAFDRCGGAHRAALLAALNAAVQSAQQTADDLARGQMKLLDGGGAELSKPTFSDVPPLSREAMLADEKATLGFYVTSHPLEPYAGERRGLNWPPEITLARLQNGDLADGAIVAVAGMISHVKSLVTKKGRTAGRKMAAFTLEDLDGRVEAIIFPDDYDAHAEHLRADAVVYIRATVDRSRDRTALRVYDIRPLERACEECVERLRLRLPRRDPAAAGDALDRVAETLGRHAGPCPVEFFVPTAVEGCRTAVLEAGPAWQVRTDRACRDELKALLGAQALTLLAKEPEGPPERGRYRGGNGNGRRDGP